MGLASLIAGMAGAAASAVNSAMSSSKKPSSSTSSGSSSSSNSSGSSSSSSRPSSGSSSGSSSSSSSSSTGFDKNTDYQAQINDAVSKGNYTLAAQLEQQRNNKINAGYGGDNKTTNLYSQYLQGNSSSGSSSSGTGSSGGTYKPLGVYNDADLQKYYPQVYDQLQQLKNQASEAKRLGDTDLFNQKHNAAESIRAQYGYSGGSDGSQFLPTGMGYTIADMANQKAESDQIIADLQNTAAQYQQQQQQQLDNINAQYEAALGQMQANIDAQKQDAAKQTALNNAAAEQAYMTAVKPNGSLAENLAANGLLSSGLTETSQIQAGNTYQNALNNNSTTQTELIAELERMAAQAEYTNDLERLQAIQQVMAQIAETGYASAKDIASLRQWSVENSQNYNTQQKQLEMQRQQIQEDLANGKIDRQTAEKQLEYLNAQIEEIQLTNKYNKYQLGQLGIS